MFHSLLTIVVILLINAVHGKSTTAPGVTLQESVVYHNTSRFPYNHMTMIEQISETFFLMAWQASHIGEGHLDQRIVLSKSTDGGKTWSEPRDILFGYHKDCGPVPVWGPALLYNQKQKKLFLYFSEGVEQNFRKSTASKHYPGGDIKYVTSTDFGETWSEKEMILPFVSKARGNISKMTANKPIFVSQDQQEWILPFWQEFHDARNDTGPRWAGVLATTDGGKTYTPFGEISYYDGKTWLIENSLAVLDPMPASQGFGLASYRVLQYFRTQIGYLYASLSSDGGKTWGPIYKTNVENPDSKAYLAAFLSPSGIPQHLVLACNPDKKGRNLLSFLGVESVQPSGVEEFSVLAVLENDATAQWDYPTVSPLLPHSGINPGEVSYAISYSAFSHQGAKIAWVVMPQQNHTKTNPNAVYEKKAKVATAVVSAVLGVLGLVGIVWLYMSTRHGIGGEEKKKQKGSNDANERTSLINE